LHLAFILEQIIKTENPEATLENFKSCVEKANSLELYHEFLNGGVKCFIREEYSKL